METILANENNGHSNFSEKASQKSSLDIFAHRPDDGNCLFWSVAFAYLNACYAVSPPHTNLVARLQKLIGEPGNASQSIRCLEANMKNFLKTSNSDFIFNEDFKSLIAQLRKHTVNFMCQHKEAYSVFIEGDFDNYLKEMSLSGAWCGEIEITALCNLLSCEINVYDRVKGTYNLYKPGSIAAASAMADHITLYLSFENNSRYAFTFPETNVPRERKESFHELPSIRGIADSFFAEAQRKNDEVNPEDPQPGIKASR